MENVSALAVLHLDSHCLVITPGCSLLPGSYSRMVMIGQASQFVTAIGASTMELHGSALKIPTKCSVELSSAASLGLANEVTSPQLLHHQQGLPMQQPITSCSCFSVTLQAIEQSFTFSQQRCQHVPRSNGTCMKNPPPSTMHRGATASGPGG